jgi:hypothetical protein
VEMVWDTLTRTELLAERGSSPVETNGSVAPPATEKAPNRGRRRSWPPGRSCLRCGKELHTSQEKYCSQECFRPKSRPPDTRPPDSVPSGAIVGAVWQDGASVVDFLGTLPAWVVGLDVAGGWRLVRT